MGVQHDDKFSWTDANVDLLKSMWAAGKSAAQIAWAFGHDVSRSAVIGKIHRMGLNRRHGESRHKISREAKNSIRRAARAAKATASLMRGPKADLKELRRIEAEMNAEAPGDIGTARKGVVELEPNDCRWPIGDPLQAGFHFCGRTKLDGISYCEFHARKAFRQAPPRNGQFVDLQRAQRERKAS